MNKVIVFCAFFLLNSALVVAMGTSEDISPDIKIITKTWTNQDVFTIERSSPQVKSSIIFCIPTKKDLLPIIGYSCCTCKNVKGLSQDLGHKEKMEILFRMVLSRLAARGFKQVKFTRTLLDSPECLASFMNDPVQVPIIEQHGAEITINTDLSKKS